MLISSRHSSPRFPNSAGRSPQCSKANSRGSSIGSSKYSSPARYSSPSRPRILSFRENSYKNIVELSKVRAKKLSKILEIETKQKVLHKKLKILISEEIKSRKKQKSTQLKTRGDNALAMIMKESAQNLLELETKAQKLAEDNQVMRQKLGLKEEVSVQVVISQLAGNKDFEEIEVERNEHYLLCMDDIAEIILIRFQHLDFHRLAGLLAGNIENERLKLKQLQMENFQVLQNEKKNRDLLEAEVKNRELNNK